MALSLKTKKAIVEQVNTIAVNTLAVGVAEYRGLSVENITTLRVIARDNNVVLRVVKNTLAKKAIVDTDCNCITDVLVGPVILGFSAEDPGAVARVFEEFTKNNDTLIVKGLGVAGDFVEASELKRIALLPTKEQAISILMSLMLAPTEKLVRTLNEIPTKITRVVAAVRDLK